MHKSFKVVVSLVMMITSFLIGWRVMPKIWPTIKMNVVYRVFPNMEPTPAPTMEPYKPVSNSTVDTSIAKTDSLVYYFYRPACSYCRAMAPLMTGLPQQITLPDGTTSNVKLVAISKSDDVGGALIADYYSEHEIAEDDRYVPAVVIGDRYLSPNDEITEYLLTALVSGEGLSTPLINGGERVSAEN